MDPETARLLELCGRLLLVARPFADQIGRVRASGWVRDERFGVELVLIGAADVAEMGTLTGLGVAGVLPLLPTDKSPTARLSAGVGVRRFNAAAASLARSLAELSRGTGNRGSSSMTVGVGTFPGVPAQGVAQQAGRTLPSRTRSRRW